MSQRRVSAYAVRLVELEVSWGGAVPRPRRREERFLGVVTTDGNARHHLAARRVKKFVSVQ
jgi:hypothetical protein